MPLTLLYNLWRNIYGLPKNWYSSMSPTTSSSPSFCRTELQRALHEQAFGISNFSLAASSSDQATASVRLLEGTKIVVQLTMQGYSVISGAPNKGPYETAENLLESISPLYSKRRSEALISALSKLS